VKWVIGDEIEYGLTQAAIKARANEAFKIKDVLPNAEVMRQNNDGTSNMLASQTVTALSGGWNPERRELCRHAQTCMN
jgi:hypothetical protein